MLWFTRHQLKSKNLDARRKAVEELCQSAAADSRAVQTLIGVMGDSDAEIRRMAITAIGKSEYERRAEPVRKALGDADPGVKKAAILAVKRLKDDSLLKLLPPLLLHTDFGVRGAAAHVLDNFKWTPPDEAQELAFVIAKGQLLRAASFGRKAVGPLEHILNTGPYHARVAAVDALSRIGDPRVLKLVRGALKSSDAAVCVAAVYALGKMGQADAWEGIAAVSQHQDARLRTAAAETLGKLGVAKAAEPLRKLLKDSHWDVRRATAEALGRLKDAKAISPLTERLKDDDADVREAAAIALGALGDRSAIGPLVMTLKDSTSSVRRIAAAALARLDEDWSSSEEAQKAVEQLKAAINGSDPEIRSSISRLLASLGASKDASAEWDTKFTPSDKRQKLAISLLATVLEDLDRDLRRAAAEALGRLGGQRAEAALTRALSDSDPGVQEAVQLSLRKVEQASRK